jgi:hypothetical protein
VEAVLRLPGVAMVLCASVVQRQAVKAVTKPHARRRQRKEPCASKPTTDKELMQTTGEKSITAAIRMALQDYLAGLRKQKLLALRGQVQIEDTWQHLRQLDTAP